MAAATGDKPVVEVLLPPEESRKSNAPDGRKSRVHHEIEERKSRVHHSQDHGGSDERKSRVSYDGRKSKTPGIDERKSRIDNERKSKSDEKKSLVPPPIDGEEEEDEEEGEEEEGEYETLADLCNGDMAGLLDDLKKSLGKRPLTKEEKLRLVMKPLVQKCIPDKDPKQPKKPNPIEWTRGPSKREKEVNRRTSKLIFTMPAVRDPAETQRLKTEKNVHKLIKYMKKSWRVKVDERQAERELVYRTINTVSTKKPENWRELVERREQVATETGFFCGFDGPYAPLINLELDTAMLVFNNLPPDLKITAARWLRDKARKEDLKRKRDAYLPRLPRNKNKRPNFTKGKLMKDPGGQKDVDEFVKIAEQFQRLCRGTASYGQVLQDWTQKKEENNESVNYGFGTVRPGFRYGFKALRDSDEDYNFSEGAEGARMDDGTDGKAARSVDIADRYGNNAADRRDSLVDGRKYQREMIQMEDMITALYDIVKSMLNIRVKQLQSHLPLPVEVVLHLREQSPEPRVSKQTKKSMAANAQGADGKEISVLKAPPGKGQDEMSDDEDCKALEDAMKESIHEWRFNEELHARLANPATLHVQDLINFDPIRSSDKVVEEVKRVHSLQEQMAQKLNSLSAQQKIKSLVEPPEHAAQRQARNAATYTRLFERNVKQKKPIWQNVQVDNYINANQALNGKDAANLTEADAELMVETAIRKRQMGHNSRRWPDVDQIPTPTFPFGRSPRRVRSEDLSRLNLLKQFPDLDAVPGTPVRRLFKLAGVRTTDKQTYNVLLDMKRSFRATEKKVRVYYQNEIGKMEFDTVKRYKCKLNALYPSPVYQTTIKLMRKAMKNAITDEDEDGLIRSDLGGGTRRQALWFRKLLEDCGNIGAIRHSGCQIALEKLTKYCDIDVRSKPNLLSRLALLVISLPATELGERHWQLAIVFLLENLFGAPTEVLLDWLKYRNMPLLVS